MTPEQLLLTLMAGALGAFLGAYFNEKGKNLATKEDVGQITKTVEEIRSEYAKEIEDLRGRFSLRTAALERRLEAHQQAYTLWRKLLNVMGGEHPTQAILDCQEWWNKNCLYLAPGARDAFYRAFSAASHYGKFAQAAHNSPSMLQEHRERDELIKSAGRQILEAVALPPIAEELTHSSGVSSPLVTE